MQVRSTAKFFVFIGKFQTPEGGFGQATAYVNIKSAHSPC